MGNCLFEGGRRKAVGFLLARTRIRESAHLVLATAIKAWMSTIVVTDMVEEKEVSETPLGGRFQ